MKLLALLTAASHGNGRCLEVTTERWHASNGKFVKLQDEPQQLTGRLAWEPKRLASADPREGSRRSE